jgi:hypothetical protein
VCPRKYANVLVAPSNNAIEVTTSYSQNDYRMLHWPEHHQHVWSHRHRYRLCIILSVDSKRDFVPRCGSAATPPLASMDIVSWHTICTLDPPQKGTWQSDEQRCRLKCKIGRFRQKRLEQNQFRGHPRAPLAAPAPLGLQLGHEPARGRPSVLCRPPIRAQYSLPWSTRDGQRCKYKDACSADGSTRFVFDLRRNENHREYHQQKMM